MIEELQDNIKTGDALKAQLVLAHLEQVDQKTRNRLVYILSRADADFSVPLFIYLLDRTVGGCRGDADHPGDPAFHSPGLS